MAQIKDSDKTLIHEAQGYVYHVLFKESMFQPNHDITCFTLPQLISAFREGFNYLDSWGKNHRLSLCRMDVVLIYRIGLSDFVEIEKVPELALLLSHPQPNV